MSTYTYRQTEYHQLNRVYEYSFDVTDQSQWDELLDLAKSNGHDIKSLPTQAPHDPELWKELIELAPIDELAEYEDDCWTMNKGGYDVDSQLLDEDGNEI